VKFHFLVEGPSEVRLLEGMLPRLLPKHSFVIHPHQGKGKLPDDPLKPPDPVRRGVLDVLPATLRAWGKALSPDTDRVVLLVDLDNDDCAWLLERLSDMIEAIEPAPSCLFRIAIEEVEAWYLGDWAAMKRAFPRAGKKALASYGQDTICGSWEVFQKVIQDPLERKPFWAEKMGLELSVDTDKIVNKSVSFQKFCAGVQRLAGDVSDSPRARSKRAEQRARTAAKKGSAKR
jgi:hypothetical protein